MCFYVFLWFWLSVWPFFVIVGGRKNRVLCPILTVKMQKNGGFLRVFSDFWCVFGVKMVCSCVKIKNLLKIYRYMYKLK